MPDPESKFFRCPCGHISRFTTPFWGAVWDCAGCGRTLSSKKETTVTYGVGTTMSVTPVEEISDPGGVVAFRDLPDGRRIDVVPLTFGRARIGVGMPDGGAYDDVW